MNVASCNSGKEITVTKFSECSSSSNIATRSVKKSCPTICFALYEPVCGSNGQTYSKSVGTYLYNALVSVKLYSIWYDL